MPAKGQTLGKLVLEAGNAVSEIGKDRTGDLTALAVLGNEMSRQSEPVDPLLLAAKLERPFALGSQLGAPASLAGRFSNSGLAYGGFGHRRYFTLFALAVEPSERGALARVLGRSDQNSFQFFSIMQIGTSAILVRLVSEATTLIRSA